MVGRRLALFTIAYRFYAGEEQQIIFLLGYHENPRDEKFDPPGSSTINKQTVKPLIDKYLDAASGGDGFCRAARILG